VLLNVLEHVCRALGDGVSCSKPGETHETVGTGYVSGQPVKGMNKGACKPAGSAVTGDRGACFTIGDLGVPLEEEADCLEKKHPPPSYSASGHPAVNLGPVLGPTQNQV